ncbi:MAG: hypothetical protein ABII20_03110 [Candidatus Omnitrophota bacterium]|nr:hypothetical protein [bacterium]
MKIAKRQCKICHKWFSPNPRTYQSQRCCSNTECQRKRKARTKKNWWKKNPGYNKDRKVTIRCWLQAHPDYWREYRKAHPDYVRKDSKRRCNKYRQEKLSAKQDLIREISVGKLKSIKEIRPDSSAKQDPIQRRQNGIIDYLYWKESSAKQDVIDNQVCNRQ